MQHTKISLGTWEITDAAVVEYLVAAGHELPIYLETGTAPPLMLAARAVGRLLERLSLPDGTIHSLQNIETVHPARIGVSVSAVAKVEPTRQRSGMRFVTINYTVTDDGAGLDLIRGRTTILLPADDHPD